jgi:hypothetical protein
MTSDLQVSDGAAIGLISFAVLEVFRTYRDVAPSLTEVRTADKDDWTTKQRLVDANVMSGIIVVLMGVAGVILMNKRWPLLFLVITWAAVAGYYYLVQQSPNSHAQAVSQ